MINFDPILHRYFNDKNETYESTTKFLGKFKKPFDELYWSKYKAIERFIIDTKGKELWKEKKGLLNTFNINQTIYKLGFDIIENYRQVILLEWKSKKDIACNRGTEIHKQKELKTIEDKGLKVFNNFIPLQDSGREDLNLKVGIYPELLLWNDEYKKAGTSDIVIIHEDKYFDIDDYKSNKEIKTEPFKNYKTGEIDSMLKPISHLGNCNFIHYAIQMNIYAWFLIQKGYKLNVMRFTHCITEKEDSIDIIGTKTYIIPNLQEEIQAMLDYKK